MKLVVSNCHRKLAKSFSLGEFEGLENSGIAENLGVSLETAKLEFVGEDKPETSMSYGLQTVC